MFYSGVDIQGAYGVPPVQESTFLCCFIVWPHFLPVSSI